MPYDETIASKRTNEAFLDTAFFKRPPEAVAADLLGATLHYDGVGGIIVETDA